MIHFPSPRETYRTQIEEALLSLTWFWIIPWGAGGNQAMSLFMLLFDRSKNYSSALSQEMKSGEMDLM